MVYPFTNPCLFHKLRDMFRCIFLLQIWIIFCTNVGVILVDFWHKKKSVFDTEFLKISWCVIWRLLGSKMLHWVYLWRPTNYQKSYIFLNHAFWSPKGWFGGPQGSFDVILGLLFHGIGIVFCCIRTSSEESGWGGVAVGESTVS